MNSEDYKKIFVFHDSYPDRIISRESGWLEFKESFNWSSKDEYAKTMAAFANNNGGYIVFGVKDRPKEITGLKNNNFDDCDEAKISGYINGSFSPEIIFEKFVVQVRSKNIGILFTHKAKYKPIICTKNTNVIKESDIYYRYGGRSEKIKYPEFKLIIEQVLEEERKRWWEHFEKISKIGTINAAILDLNNGEISGHAGTLVIDKKLIPKLKFIKEGIFREGGRPVLKLIGDVKPVSIAPVLSNKKYINTADIKITDDPNAPAVRLAEEEILKRYPLDYRALVKNLHEKYSNFKVNNFFYNKLKEFKENKKLCWIRVLNPNNSKSAKTYFYSLKILEEFDKYY
ncbi:MAG: AlbA family DNA-binding domain-containing protein [bacterium]